LGQEVQTYLVDEKVYLPHTYLKKLREQAGLTQRDLSLAMGYRGHGTIAMAETGVRERTAVRAIEFLQDRFGIGVPALETTPSSEADLSCATVVV
jgi:transcriptional regulator with XRE-family HTH domain